jgi:crotonobetainyl-CoA:carnitine CoA-transferase CaiB-like acyl-CoA transferase
MGPLDGIRVLEAGLLVQGPQASLTMLEWGADVIKVELPGFGDQSRWLPISREDRRSAFFAAYNRGKRSVTIDLRVPRGREVFLRMVETADVVITNFKPGTMDEWGVGYTDAAARNQRIIYAMGSSFGTEGPDAAREGADLGAQAAGGLISTTGGNGGDPSAIGPSRRIHQVPPGRAALRPERPQSPDDPRHLRGLPHVGWLDRHRRGRRCSS